MFTNENKIFPIRAVRLGKSKTGICNKKMKFDLKKANSCAIFLKVLQEHGAFAIFEGVKTRRNCELINRYFMQASNQKTPALKRKSRVASVYLDKKLRHTLLQAFSGAGVPLIGMFQGDAFFVLEFI